MRWPILGNLANSAKKPSRDDKGSLMVLPVPSFGFNSWLELMGQITASIACVCLCLVYSYGGTKGTPEVQIMITGTILPSVLVTLPGTLLEFEKAQRIQTRLQPHLTPERRIPSCFLPSVFLSFLLGSSHVEIPPI